MQRLVILIATSVLLMVVFDFGISDPIIRENHSFLERETLMTQKRVDSAFFPKNLSVVALGDSLTSGFGDDSGNKGYTTVLESMLRAQRGVKEVKISNHAIGGIRSDQFISELNHMEVRQSIDKADYIIITIGGNDVMKAAQENIFELTSEAFEKENELFIKNVNIMVHKIKFYNPTAKLFFVGIYNPFSTLFASVPEIDKIIENWNTNTEFALEKYDNTFFIPISDVFKGREDELLFEDYIHPNEEGYKYMAIRVLTYIDHFDHTTTYVIANMEEEKY